MFVVPKGVEHKPYAEHEVKLLLIEPRGVLNTGHEGGERTAQNDVWIEATRPVNHQSDRPACLLRQALNKGGSTGERAMAERRRIAIDLSQ